MTEDQKAMNAIALKHCDTQFSLLAPNMKEVIAAAIEYGRKTATETTAQRPVITTAEPGKKFPITEAHSAAMELHDLVVNAFKCYEEKPANHPNEEALMVLLADLMEQALYLQGTLGKLARAEK